MPDISNIDTEKIRSAVGQLEGITGRITGCVSKFGDAVINLDKGWVSEVKGAFMQNVEKDMEAMQEMLFQLQEVSEGLTHAASDFDKTESEIKSGVNALR
jgi:uncharacterized protein YukE